MKRFSLMQHLTFPAVLLLISVAPALAQQGQYHLSNIPFILPGVDFPSGIATYSPIQAVSGDTILLRGEGGQKYSFNLTADTIYCEGAKRVPDWTYLQNRKKKGTITILTLDVDIIRAVVVWDQAPTISLTNGKLVFALPPMCN